MKVSVDRFEDGFAVVELPSGGYENLPTALVPDAKEGDVIDISVDCEETQRRRQEIAELTRKIFGEH